MVAPSESVGEVRRSAAGRNKPCATEAFKSQRSGQAAVSYDCSHLLKSALPAAVSSAFSLQQGSSGSPVKSPSDESFFFFFLLCYPLLFPPTNPIKYGSSTSVFVFHNLLPFTACEVECWKPALQTVLHFKVTHVSFIKAPNS